MTLIRLVQSSTGTEWVNEHAHRIGLRINTTGYHIEPVDVPYVIELFIPEIEPDQFGNRPHYRMSVKGTTINDIEYFIPTSQGQWDHRVVTEFAIYEEWMDLFDVTFETNIRNGNTVRKSTTSYMFRDYYAQSAWVEQYTM